MESEALLRLSIFIAVFGVLAVAEAMWPRRVLAIGRVQRWGVNVGLSVLNTALLRLSFFIVPALTVLAAAYAEGRGWGLMPALGLPMWLAAVVGFLALDLAVYAQHAAFHFVAPLWRLHRVHHVDGDIDVSTGVRFHPGEMVLSQVWKIAVVLALGVPAVAVLVFEIVLSAGALFTHANIRLPRAVDSVLRLVVVTPDMHRVHHSATMGECNSNFGFNVSIWDRVFGTYREQPAAGHTAMTIGLPSYRDAAATRLIWLLGFPFVRGPAA